MYNAGGQSLKKVLVVLNSGLVNAGVPKVMVDILEGLKHAYVFDFVVQSEGEDYYDSAVKKNGSKIFYIGKNRSGIKKYIYNLFIRNIQLYSIIKRNGPYQIIHCCDGLNSGLTCQIAKRLNVQKRIIHSHGTYLPYHGKNVLQWIYQKKCKDAIKKMSTQRIAVSRMAGDSLFENSSYHIIYNAVDLEKYSNLVKVKHEGINILQIGYFNSNKNQLFTIELLKKLHERNKNVSLYFIGFANDATYLRKVQTKIKEYGLQDSVIFLPHDYNKLAIFPIIDCIVIPSYREGFSIVALEAQASNIKCIASLAVPHDANCGLASFANIENIEQWIDEVVSRNVKKLDIKEISRFSLEKHINAIKDVYETK